ncbi:MAG: glycoside hydrolase family 25 protein [Fimbriimonadaceae bacterium]|nr:glycoside hydrolase family 25 protein [Alphaproteobacteria bacterium]
MRIAFFLFASFLIASCGSSAPNLEMAYVSQSRFGDVKPVNFVGGSPHGFAIHGIDVARYQGEIDWHMTSANGISFAYIKATEGGDVFDIAFDKNWAAAKAAGVPRGAYHFYYFCRTAEEQAKWFIENVPVDPEALPPVLDIEWNAHSASCPTRPSRAHIISEMRIFMSMLEQHYGKRPIIYTAPDFYEANLRSAFLTDTFWLRSVTAHPRVKYGSRKWLFWQYTGTGRVPGVEGDVDLNVFNGDAEAWRQWLESNGGTSI